MRKRLLSLLLVLCMVLTLVPTTAFAVEGKVQTPSATNPFTDVKEGDWCYDAVQYARMNGFFNGTSAHTFTPNGTMTRAMFVTVLGRMAGVDTELYEDEKPFSDVPSRMYYAPYVAWAYKHGITGGTGDGKFSPDGLINRQQMATFFVRYFEAFDVDYETDANITTVPADLDSVAPYAKDAVLKLWKQGLLNGDGTNFNPTGNATRAQAATMTMRADKAVDTWYKEPGVESDRVEIDPAAGETETPETPETPQEPSGGSSSGGSQRPSDSNDPAVTGQCRVTFELGKNVSSTGVSITLGEEDGEKNQKLPVKKLYPVDTLISELPTPFKENSIFVGWFYDKAMTKPVQAEDVLDKNITLYAKLADGEPVTQQELATFATATVPAKNVGKYTFTLKATAEGVDLNAAIESFIQVSAGNAAMVKVAADETPAAGQYKIDSTGKVVAGFEQGQNYRVVLKEDAEVEFVLDGVAQGKSVRSLSIITEKEEVQNLNLSNGIKYLPRAQVSEMTGVALDGLFSVGNAATRSGSTQNRNQGTFVFEESEDYYGNSVQVGDTVAIYEGKVPDQRNAVKMTRADEIANEGAVAYVEIYDYDEATNTYYYRTADTEDVLFTPDIIPIPATADEDTVNNQITVENSLLEFNTVDYQKMGLTTDTVVEPGDYVALYTGVWGDESSEVAYGCITDVRENAADGTTVIQYTATTQEKVFESMDIYASRNEKVELTDEEKKLIEDNIAKSAEESGFLEEAAEYLTALAIETDGFKELSDDLDLDVTAYNIVFDDGTLDPESMDLMELQAEIDKDETDVKVNIMTGDLTHFKDGELPLQGLRLELVMSFAVSIKSGDTEKMRIEMQAIFEQEVLLSINVSGGAIWKWAWIIPYLYDYNLNANLDVGTYTGIGITATAKTVAPEDEEKKDDEIAGDFNWKEVIDATTGVLEKTDETIGEVKSAYERITNIGDEIKELMESKQELFRMPNKAIVGDGESAGTVEFKSLEERYSEMMEEAEDTWVDIVEAKIFESSGFVDPFHILVYGINADFVVGANLYITMGMTFEYEVAKRYNFSLMLFHGKVTNETIDLVPEHYQFDFYVMGTAGIRAGIEFEIEMGLFCLELDSIGISAEVGAYAQLWGYFYYHLEWAKGEGKQSTCSGALAIEIGAYLSIKFKAQMLNMDKLTYNPTLYEDEFPILTIGSIENIRDFNYGEDDDLVNVTMKSVKTIELPTELFEMAYMDMKTGELHGGEDDDEPINYDDDTESRFIIELSNPKFSYDPATNTITADVDPENETSAYCEMTITWGGAPLAFTSESISRTVSIEWMNPAGVRTISFSSNGGTPVPAIVLGWGNTINKFTAPEGEDVHYAADPVRQGYDFLGWYHAATGEKFEIPNEMPNYDKDPQWGRGVLVYAKWKARDDTPYTLHHYVEQPNGKFELVATTKHEGTTMTEPTKAEIAAIAADHYDDENYYLGAYQAYAIAPDGKMSMKLYYRRETFTVTVDYNKDALAGIPVGATDPLYITGKYGSEVIVPTLTFEGCKFNGYTGPSELKEVTQEDGTVYYVATVNGNATYLAQWEMKSNIPYRVEHYFKQPGLTGGYKLAENGVEYKFGATKDRVYPADCAWTGDKLGQGYKVREKDPYRVEVYGLNTYEDTTQWRVAADGSTVIKIFYDLECYDVEYMLDGATYHEVSIEYGELIPAPWQTVVAPTGKVFNGWYLKNENGSWGDKVNVGYVYLNDLSILGRDGKLTLHARFDLTEYAVNYNLDGGKLAEGDSNPTSVNVESGYITLKSPTKVGHDFSGWTGTGISGDAPVKSPSINPATMTAEQLRNLSYTAHWEKLRYSITYNSNGGTPVISDMVLYGDPIPERIPVKEGWIFDGWYYNDGQSLLFGTMPAENLAVTAKWSREKHYVYFDTVGGSHVMPILVEYDTELPELAVPTKDGYTFGGWRLENNQMPPKKMPNNDITLIAQWTPNKYTITFDTDGGSAVESITADYMASISAPANPTKEGHTFVKWDTAVPAKMPAGGMTIKAIWKVNQYTITFDTNGGTEMSPMKVNYGATIVVPETPVRQNYTFEGWEGLPETMPAANLTVKAMWQGKTYQIRYEDVDGVTGYPANYPTQHVFGIATTIPDPVKPGYEFTGWQINGSGSKINLTFYGDSVKADVTLTATWKAGNSDYTVNHYWQKPVGEGYDLHASKTYTGKTGEWTNVTAEKYTGLNAKFFDQQTIQADGTTKVDIYYDRLQYQVKFNLGDAAQFVQTTISPIWARYGATIEKPAEPTWQNHELEGWYYKNSYGVLTKWDFDATTVAGTTELIAQWEEVDQADYTINYYEMGLDGQYPTEPTRSEEDSAYVGVKVTASAAEGFTMDTAHEGHVAEGTVSAMGLTLNVYLSRNKYTLTVKPGNGQENIVEEYYYGAPLELPELTRAGYTFQSWDGKSDNMPAKHHTLTAVWKGMNFIVKFEANLPADISADKLTGTMADQNLTFGPDAKLQTNAFELIGTGYGFKGWNTQADGSGTDFTNGAVFNKAPESDGQTVTLYAQWVKGKTVRYYVHYHIMNAKGQYCGYHNYSVSVSLEGTQYGYAEFPAVDSEAVAKSCVSQSCGGYDFKGNEEHFTMVLPENQIIEEAYQAFDVYYVRNRYPLTLDPNDGYMPAGTILPDGTELTQNSTAPVKVGEYYFNAEVKVPELNKNPEREGYFCSGTKWKTADGEWTSGKMDRAGLVLVPAFKPARACLYFWLTPEEINTSLYPYAFYEGLTDEPFTMPADPTRDGYIFKGWDQTLTKYPAGYTNVVALWETKEYKITFKSNPPYSGTVVSGTMPSVSGYKYFTDQALPANNYSCYGYKFKGWNTQANGKGTMVSDMGLVGNTVKADFATDELVLYAQWEAYTGYPAGVIVQVEQVDGSYRKWVIGSTAKVYPGYQVDIVEELIYEIERVRSMDSAGFVLDNFERYYTITEDTPLNEKGTYYEIDLGIKVQRRKFNLTWDPNGGIINSSTYTPSGTYYYGTQIYYPRNADGDFINFNRTLVYDGLFNVTDNNYVLPNTMPAYDLELKVLWKEYT